MIAKVTYTALVDVSGIRSPVARATVMRVECDAANGVSTYRGFIGCLIPNPSQSNIETVVASGDCRHRSP